MTPAGLLAIIAVGMVLAYVLPQRIKERSDYALVRTEDRYSAEMRVVRSTAERATKAASRPSTDSGEVPLLVTGAARASISALGDEQMSRPSGPLDRAATTAQRERLALRSDRAAVLAERAQRAKRRARVAAVVAVISIAAWILVGATGFPAIVAAVATAGFAGVVVAGSRTAAAQRKADRNIRLIAREVEAAATATQALRRVAKERSEGLKTVPSDVETQAIRIVTTEDLAPLAAPAPVPAPELPDRAIGDVGVPDASWSPNAMPAPAYTLKASVRRPLARPITDEDLAASARKAEKANDARAAREEATASSSSRPAITAQNSSPLAPAGANEAPTTGALDDILARRRQASA
jgi:Flp pilus assembly protein TadB